jgi:hypothetical protein
MYILDRDLRSWRRLLRRRERKGGEETDEHTHRKILIFKEQEA